nr:hydrogenase maturation protease [uncultured Desulfobulbus sp.]
MHISHKKIIGECPVDIVVLGCGNILLGDDGFGPAVVARLEQEKLSERVQVLDVGTSVRELLLDYLMAPALRPSLLFIVDATYQDQRSPGALVTCRPAELPCSKVHDFSLHQFPTVNLLVELEQETGIRVELVLAQASIIPEEIAPGLTPAMEHATELAVKMILKQINEYVTPFSSGTVVASSENVS